MVNVMRSVKNVTKGYTTAQVKVRNATSNDAWGPTGSEMSEIAQMTFNNSSDFYEIMAILDKRLNDKGKNWRHVLKALKVLDYALHEGSELVVHWAVKNVYIIKTLREFQYVDEDGKDVGLNVRLSAKDLTSLVLDEERLKTERSDRKTWKSRVTGLEEFAPSYIAGGSDESPRQPRRTRRNDDEEDAEYKLALEASKYEAEEEQRRRNKPKVTTEDDDDLAKAIKLSKEEEDLRRRELEENNAAAIFSDAPAAAQPTGYNQGYQQGGAVDWDGNQYNQQQQQPTNTGFLNSAYSNPTGYGGQQQTGFQNMQTGYQNGFQQQQPGIFDQQQFQPQQQQQPYMQPQSTAFGQTNNPYGQNSYDFTGMNQQQQQPQPQQQHQDNLIHPGSNNPYASQQQGDELKPLQTGSNNPFASSLNRPQPSQTHTAPTLDSLQEQKVQTQFSKPSFAPQQQQPRPNPPPPQQEEDPQRARLNALLASGEGLDSYGNTGELRIPAHHTAPGTFVNSAGTGINKLGPNQTGNNPFFQSQQFTGAPGQQQSSQQQQQRPSGFGGNPSPFGSAPPQQAPAQTGPAGNFGGNFGGGAGGGGFPNANDPYRQQYPTQQGGAAGGSLIDL